ncbi:DMT family transporter [Bacillus sp. SL00103]
MNYSKQKAYLCRDELRDDHWFSFLFVKIALESETRLIYWHTALPFLLSRTIAVSIFTKEDPPPIQWRDLLYIMPFSLLYPVFFAFQVWGLMYTSSSEAGIIQATIPILTMVLAAWFLKERATWIKCCLPFFRCAGDASFRHEGIDVKHSHMIGYVLILLSSLILQCIQCICPGHYTALPCD